VSDATKDRIHPIFCAVSHATVASDTENHGLRKHPFKWTRGRLPDAREPVRDEHVEAEEEDEHGGAVLEVAVQLSDNSTQTQQPNNFEGTEETADALKEKHSKGQCDGRYNQLCYQIFGKKGIFSL
jgi:hypothetical protein